MHKITYNVLIRVKHETRGRGRRRLFASVRATIRTLPAIARPAAAGAKRS